MEKYKNTSNELDTLRKEVKELKHAKSEHQRIEDLLGESEKRYQTLTENIAIGLYRRTAGPKGRLIVVNRAFISMFRHENEDELLGAPITDLYWDPSECVQFSAAMLKDKEILRQQLKMRRKDNTPIWISVTATVICDENGDIKYFDGIMEDISDRKKAEAEAILHQKQLIQADKMISLGILVSGVAHEINNPNHFIRTHIQPLKKCWDDITPILNRYYKEHGDFMMAGRKFSQRKNQIPEMFTNIITGTERIKNIVNELRDYAREQPTDRFEEIYINSVVKSALALLSNLIKKNTHTFKVSYGENLPAIMGDYQKLEQVVINTVQNACQSLDSMNATITINTYYDSKTHNITIEINDQGCGISQDDISHIKDPFFTTKRSQGGTGLGLSISASIINKHNGRLDFSSVIDKGTIVKIIIPEKQ